MGTLCIGEVRYRPDSLFGEPFGPVAVTDLTLSISSTPMAVDGLSSTFADNIGADAITVFSGSFSASSEMAGSAPHPFDINVPFTHEFCFDGSSGENLILDYVIETCPSTTALDFNFSTDDSVSSAWAFDSDDLVADVVATDGAVTQFLPSLIFADSFESGDTSAWQQACQAVWSSNGPYGGAIYEIVTAPPATLYAATFSGVFKSTDGGSSWAPADSGLRQFVTDIVLDPTTPTTLYASTTGGGVAKTDNGGTTWTEMNTGIDATSIQALAMHPDDPTHLLAGWQRVYQSTNGGSSWSPISPSLGIVYGLGFASPTVFYAATNTGFYRSDDGGANWIARNVGLTTAALQTLAVDPETPSIVHLGTSLNGTFRSTNGGDSWTSVNPNNFTNNVTIDPSNSDRIFAASSHGIFESTDQGLTWTRHSDGTPLVAARAIDVNPSDPSLVYAGFTPSGFYRSANAGVSWSESNSGFSAIFLNGVEVDPTDPSRVYAVGGQDFVYRSTDAGVSWTGSSENLFSVSEIVIDHGDSSILYIATGLGVYRSVDYGLTWNQSDLTEGTYALSLSQDPDDPNVLLAGTIGVGIYKSTDRGLTWSLSNDGIGSEAQVFSVKHDPTNGLVTYATDQRNSTVYKSVDGGTSWVRADEGLPGGSYVEIGVNPHDSSMLLLGTTAGVMRSNDGASTWQPTSLVGTFASKFVFDPNDLERIYVADSFGGVFGSGDGGVTWRALISGLTTLRVEGLGITPDSSKLYAVTFGRGVFELQTAGLGCL